MNWVQENQYVDGYSGKDQPSFPERSMCFSQFTFLFGFNFFLTCTILVFCLRLVNRF